MPALIRITTLSQEQAELDFAATHFQEWPNCGRGVWLTLTQVLASKGVSESGRSEIRANSATCDAEFAGFVIRGPAGRELPSFSLRPASGGVSIHPFLPAHGCGDWATLRTTSAGTFFGMIHVSFSRPLPPHAASLDAAREGLARGGRSLRLRL